MKRIIRGIGWCVKAYLIVFGIFCLFPVIVVYGAVALYDWAKE